MTKTIPIYQVDAFTDKAFSGNPAAVCILDVAQTDLWMQNVAAEMNLSETAFLVPEADGYRLRWFTPLAEVALCGHATLASSHILWETGRLAQNVSAKFFTLSGVLTARLDAQKWIELNFPVKPVEQAPVPPELAQILNVTPVFTGKNQFDFVVEVENEEIVRQVAPDFQALKKLPVRGVVVTAKSSLPEFDFVSRFFAPAVGVNEDPVTGSAHCCLAHYWSHKLGKHHFNAFQASRRGGRLKLTLEGDRVLIGGQAVTVLSGELYS
ncbi:MAG TPA: PhzF family phenazine biosynthesis protein [Anaerolineaceae bacterium]|nr:PhzF family phenazine biosynthesis protein [Anaerolineaceae bacterium]HPN50860.1 PhzF family phenazine biosynthesis protein [Anaerolineaceae bacterium]